jgi:hypothetical protein
MSAESDILNEGHISYMRIYFYYLHVCIHEKPAEYRGTARAPVQIDKSVTRHACSYSTLIIDNVTMTNETATCAADRSRTGTGNNLVAESDMKAVILALQRAVDEKIVASDHDPALRQVLTNYSNSMTRKIKTCMQPISDEEFDIYVSRFRDDQISCPFENGSNAAAKSATATDIAKDDNTAAVKDEFDEEELIDQAAAIRVRELRREVRDRVAAIQALRETTLEQALAWVERHIEQCTSRRLPTTGQSLIDPATTAVDALVLSEHASAVEEMQTSLMSLQQALQETESELPIKLRGFQDTVQTIQCSLESQANGTLSQIEQAIYNRDDQARRDGDESDSDENLTTTFDLQQLLPEDRLADLLSRVF